MKICFFANVDSTAVLDRVNFYAQDIRALREMGHEVVVATDLRGIPFGCDLYFIWWWTWAFKPLVVAGFSKKPSIITGVFNYSAPPGMQQRGGFFSDRPRWQQHIIRWSLRRATANVFISQHEMTQVTAAFKLTNSYYVPLTVDTEQYVPNGGVKDDIIVNIAWSGQLNGQRKCLRQIIEALPYIRAQQPTVRLVMAGQPGDYHDTLVATAKQARVLDAVDFVGVVSEETKIELMQRCAVYLQPTLYEGFGLAVAEAMACEAAVISSPQGSIPEVVGDAGLMVNGENPVEIAHATCRLLNDRKLSNDLGKRARQRVVEHFGFEQRKRGLDAIIAKVVRPS